MKSKFQCIAPMALGALLTTACGESDDERKAEGRTASAISADIAFWALMHDENQDYATVVEALESAAEEEPADALVAAHLGWAHFLAFSEGVQRGEVPPADIPGHLSAAAEQFAKATSMAPGAGPIRAFLGYTRRAIAFQMDDDELFSQGMADVEASIELWPEFALFGAFYSLDALLPADSPLFSRAVESYWAWLDLCAREKLDRENPDWSSSLSLETQEGPDRACWNSWIVPYNRQGAALIIGDALVKSGELEAAEVMYLNAKLGEAFDTWPLKSLLESRLENIEQNAVGFQKPVDLGVPNDPRTSMVFGTKNSCSVCHGGDADEYYSAPPWVGETANEFMESPR